MPGQALSGSERPRGPLPSLTISALVGQGRVGHSCVSGLSLTSCQLPVARSILPRPFRDQPIVGTHDVADGVGVGSFRYPNRFASAEA